VLSGHRSDAQQLEAAARYAAAKGTTVQALYPHGPLASNHCGTAWPRGAVDVTDPRGLRNSLARAPHRRLVRRRLVWAMDVGHDDAAHFSRNGH